MQASVAKNVGSQHFPLTHHTPTKETYLERAGKKEVFKPQNGTYWDPFVSLVGVGQPATPPKGLVQTCLLCLSVSVALCLSVSLSLSPTAIPIVQTSGQLSEYILLEKRSLQDDGQIY